MCIRDRLGLVAMLDPPREDVSEALEACRSAGIDVVMVTGDHPATAERVAEAVHLTEHPEALRGDVLVDPDEANDEERQRVLGARVLARVTPEQKLNLIAFHQGNGSIVAMTGDGVNDAPALKKADIGVAMGERGTQVAKDAGDMILMDDAFSSIVAAVAQGRAIFENIRKFVLYLLSCNSSEIVVVAVASVLNTSLPITPLQILFLNVVTDVFPALALGVGEGDPALMERQPRPKEEPVLRPRHWRTVAGYGVMIAVAVLGVFFLALNRFDMPTQQAITVSFLTLAFAQLWHVFNIRGVDSHPIKNEVTTNLYVWGALVLCSLLLVGTVYVPFMSNVLNTVNPGAQGWLLIAGGSLFPLVVGQIALLFNLGGS
ncbi:MAG: HAD-IC family P-type ATPase, partial [Chloroflexi bacterium]|nr:HAD-IC family P-type ATPase [Chloroflexota bacterium]